jgi:DNA-binding PucR family transcriptional regulator
MSFKDLNDALRINALASFLEAASQLNGVLACVAVEKSFSLTGKDRLPPLQHSWAADPLEKLLEICVFGGGFVDGLRGAGQDLHWITDDDAIVATDAAQDDAGNLMGSFLHKYPEEFLRIGLGVASQFSDDDRRAEDIVAIPDLAAGPFCEALTTLGKSNIPTSETWPSNSSLLLQLKSSLINVWRSDFDKPLRHLNVVIRATENGKTLVSFCQPFIRLLRPSESAEGAPTLNAKWRRAMETYLKDRGVDPVQTLNTSYAVGVIALARGVGDG